MYSEEEKKRGKFERLERQLFRKSPSKTHVDRTSSSYESLRGQKKTSFELHLGSRRKRERKKRLSMLYNFAGEKRGKSPDHPGAVFSQKLGHSLKKERVQQQNRPSSRRRKKKKRIAHLLAKRREHAASSPG